jgi:UDP-2-acetamido-2,6-beta-L-arabino-hexul-4-ose reductase
MKNVLVTGTAGFIGKNLVTALQRRDNVEIATFTRKDNQSVLESHLLQAHIIYHLAGVNRPETEDEFATGNVGLTSDIVHFLRQHNKTPTIVISSSTQAELENPYGRSKKAAEDVLFEYNRETGGQIAIYRLPGVFGKWSRPNYNTVVATFCYNIARGLDITISDTEHEIELVYIDDIVDAFLRHLDDSYGADRQWFNVVRTFRITLGELADRIRQLHAIRESLVVPDLADDFMKCLHGTYLSFLPENEFAYPVKLHTDDRGWLFELIKSESFGQIFVSTTRKGVVRGNHYHDSKVEKFCVIQGEAVIRFRSIQPEVRGHPSEMRSARHGHELHGVKKAEVGEVIEYPVSGKEIRVVDIPPGYTHSIENVGDDEMIVLFWANEIFDADRPDTYFEKV